MSKNKSKAKVEKLVDAQARGKVAKGTRREKSKSPGGELDTRVSKGKGFYDWIKT